jgi:hypothetical protein
MRPIAADFTPESRWTRRLLWAGVLVSAGCAAVACWQAWCDWQKLLQAQREQQVVQAQLVQRAQARLARELRLAQPKPYAKDAAELVRLASFPTDKVLRALETTQIEGVKVTSIDINPESATARVALEFTDQAQLMQYLEKVNAGEEKPRWILEQAKMQSSQGGTASLNSHW